MSAGTRPGGAARLTTLARSTIAAVAFGTIAADILLTVLAAGGVDLGNYFGQFTILSVLFVGCVALAGVREQRLPAWWVEVRGSAVVAILVTAVLHALLLGGAAGASGPVVNAVLHQVVPALAVLEWLLVPSARSPRWWSPLAGLVFPVVYLAYTLVRGLFVGWYPYAFVDPTLPGGYARLFSSLTVVLVAFVAVAILVMVAGLLRQKALPPAD